MYKNHPNAQRLGDTVFCDDCLQYWNVEEDPPVECEDPFQGEALTWVDHAVGTAMVVACAIALVTIVYLVLK